MLLMQTTPPPPPPPPPPHNGFTHALYMPVVMSNETAIADPAFSTLFCFDSPTDGVCEQVSGTQYTPNTGRPIYETHDEGIFNLFYSSMAVYVGGDSYPFMLDNHGTVESLVEFDDPGISGSIIVVLRMDGMIYFITLL